jgi:membrane protein implicated in regulation of membrane protease activity
VDAGDAWIVWLIIALVLAGAEAASAGLLLIMFAGGALAASLAAALGAGVVGSAAVFSLVSVALIAFVRPIAKRHVYQAPLERSGTAALIGTQAVVIEAVDADNGRIKLAGEIWSARTLDEDARFEPGEKVAVFEIDGATAVVG